MLCLQSVPVPDLTYICTVVCAVENGGLLRGAGETLMKAPKDLFVMSGSRKEVVISS